MSTTCAQCSATFEVTEEDLTFLKRVSPVIAGTTYDITPPTICPECRLQRRLSHRNEKQLYHRKCDKTGKQIISTIAQNKPFVVYEQKEWWGDGWDAKDYAKEFDFDRPFFEQFKQLQQKVPRMSLQQENNQNSDYTSNVSNLKNCYLLFSSDFSQDCAYGIWTMRSTDCFDNFMIDGCERAYECLFSNKIYGSRFIYCSSNCTDCDFLLDCRGCKDCFLCFGLRNKQYCISNVQYTKEEYEAKRKEFPLSSYKNLCAVKEEFAKLLKTAPRPPMWKHGTVIDCTGDLLTNAENCTDCYEITEGKDCKRTIGFQIKDAHDCTYVYGELAYENCECFPTPSHSAFNLNCYSGSNLYYCDMCMNNCQNLFGCVSLKHAQYCILNKQYTKEEYEELVPKIIEHMKKHKEWGEFFPHHLSPFGYNESEAALNYPLTEEEVKKHGWFWFTEEESSESYLGPKTEIPDDIASVDDEICNQILECEVTGKPFKMIPQELKFYRSMELPLPRRCPDQRHQDRLKMRNPRKLYERKCAKSGEPIITNYAPDRPEIVYCEEQYLESLQ